MVDMRAFAVSTCAVCDSIPDKAQICESDIVSSRKSLCEKKKCIRCANFQTPGSIVAKMLYHSMRCIRREFSPACRRTRIDGVLTKLSMVTTLRHYRVGSLSLMNQQPMLRILAVLVEKQTSGLRG